MNQSYTTIFKLDPKYEVFKATDILNQIIKIFLFIKGPHVVQTYLKKEKSTSSFKFFGDSNTRFFTLKMQTFEFYYTPKDQYQAKDIKQLDIANVKYVVDRGCEKNSRGQSKEWTHQLIIYFSNKYMVLLCQNERMKDLWLNAFKHIIRISDQKCLLHHGEVKKDENHKNQNQMIFSANNINDNSMNKEVAKESNYSSPLQDISQNQSIDSKKEEKSKHKANINEQQQQSQQYSDNNSRRSSNESVESTDSSRLRKKNRTAFKESQKKYVSSHYKKQQKFDIFWRDRVTTILMDKLENARKRIDKKNHMVQEKQIERNQEIASKQDNQRKFIEVEQNNQFEEKVEIESLDRQESPKYDSNRGDDRIKVFRKNDESKHQGKKIQRNSPQPHNSTGKKHQANIFADIQNDEVEETPSLNIKFQQKQSQNGWDGNDIDILQTILRDNSKQLKGGQAEENEIEELDNKSNLKQQGQQPKKVIEDFFDHENRKENDIQEVNIIKQQQQQPSTKKQPLQALNDYDDWDVELDNVVTPAVGNKKNLYQNNLQNIQYHQQQNNSLSKNSNQNQNTSNGYFFSNHSINMYTNNNNNNHTHSNNNSHFNTNNIFKNTTNSTQSTSQNTQQKQQIAVIDNDYDNWDDDM